jgi:hypothetical protein
VVGVVVTVAVAGTAEPAISVTRATAVISTAVASALGSEETGATSDGPVIVTWPAGILQEASREKSTRTEIKILVRMSNSSSLKLRSTGTCETSYNHCRDFGYENICIKSNPTTVPLKVIPQQYQSQTIH